MVFPRAVRLDQPHEQGREVAKDLDFLLMGIEHLFPKVKGRLRGGVGLGQPGADARAAFLSQRAADAAGHCPGRMNLLPAEHLDDFLAELAEPDAGAGQVGVGGNQPEHIALGWRRVPAEQEIGRAQVKEAQGMALDDLPEVHQAAELVGGGGDVDRHDGVARLGGGQQMADGADAANPWGDAGHLAVGATLTELLEPAELDYVKLGVGHVAGVVHEDADLGVALDTGHGVNDNALSHNHPNLMSLPASSGFWPSSTCARKVLMRSAGGGQPGRK